MSCTKPIEARILEAKMTYERRHGKKPDCVVIDNSWKHDLPAEVFTGTDLLVYGMHLILAEDMPHDVVRCGRMA